MGKSSTTMATSLSSPHYVSLLPSRKSTPVSRPAHPPTIALPQFKFGYHKKVYPAINPSRPELSAAGKTILITGGGKSIGKAILTSFALAGAKNIIITGREQAALERARDEIQTRCPETNIYAYAADVIDSERYREILEGVKAKIAPIDVLVLNAAYLPVPQPIEEMDINEFWKGFEINVKANTALAQLFCRTCSTSPTLINVSSYLAWLGAIGFAAQGYSASKAAFDLLMQYLAFQRPDMRIFTMHPGCIVSEMSTKVGADTSKSDRFDDGELMPLRYFGTT